jgi:hypothetical protein
MQQPIDLDLGTGRSAGKLGVIRRQDSRGQRVGDVDPDTSRIILDDHRRPCAAT